MSAVAELLAHRVDGPAVAATRTPVLLLNGGFMSLAAWDPVAAALAGSRPVVRCDFRGQLRSPGPPHRRLADHAADVVDLLDHLGIDRVHVVGTSFGGAVGVLLAARRPERVASLTTVALGDVATPAFAAGVAELRATVDELLAGGDRGRFHDLVVRDAYSARYAEAHRERLAERRRQVAALPDDWFAAAAGLAAAVDGLDLRPELPAIRCPVLVVAAADDRVMPPATGRALAEAIPGARLAVHPTSGHALVFEEPEWLLERVAGLFAAAGARGGGPR